MKRTYAWGALFALLVLCGLGAALLTSHEAAPVVTKSQALSGAERQQLQYDEKRDRRLAGYAKADGPDEFAQFHHDIRTPADRENPEYTMGYRLRALEQLKATSVEQARGESVTVSAWTERGPNNVAGRGRGLVIDPDDPNHDTWYIGSAGGGVWKTTDAGGTWTNLTNDLPNLSASALEMAPSNHNVMYMGTGEGFFNSDAIKGDGVWRSNDRGNSWTHLAATASNTDFAYCNRIVIDPNNEDVVLVATNTGVFKSIDGGTNWYSTLSPSGRTQDLDATSGNLDTVYASVNSVGVYRSTDGGETWSLKSNGIEPGRRIELAISPVKETTLFASQEISSQASAIYLSLDGGDSWTAFFDEAERNINYMGGQGWYDNIIEAHPFEEKSAFVGAVEVFQINATGDPIVGEPSLQGAEVNNLPFMTFVNFGGEALGGGLSVTDPTEAIDLTPEDFTSVEIRFGPGLSQMAHRFTVPDNSGSNGNGGAGVPATDYSYQDYVEVPFEVWDTDNNIQLNASFRDQEGDGLFDLETVNEADDSRAREYVFVNGTAYNASAPDANITGQSSGGHRYKQLYFLWPRLAQGSTWDPNNLPEGNIAVTWAASEQIQGTVDVIADVYGRYGGPNGSIHPDQHNIKAIITDEASQTFRLVNTNDGGAFLSDDNATTLDMVIDGLHTTQFYGADKAPGVQQYTGGMQDNGTWTSPAGEVASTSTNYNFSIGGDGFEVVWNYNDPNKIIGGSQFNGLSRTINGGASWQGATSGLTNTGSGNGAPFITKIANSKRNPDYLFVVGANGVFKSTDFGGSWQVKTMDENWTIGTFTQIEVSQADPSFVWAGSVTDYIYLSTDWGETFSTIPAYTDWTMGRITGLDTDPTDANVLYTTYSFAGRPKVLRTTDLGVTWEDLTQVDQGTGVSANGFPDVATYCVQVMPHNPDVIWVGTEIGIVESSDNGATWHMLAGDLPAVSVWQMKIVDQEVVIATHGRGIWTATIPALPEIVRIPNLLSGSISITGELNLNSVLPSAYDSLVLFLDDSRAVSFGATTVAEAATLTVTGLAEGNYQATLVGYRDSQAYTSPQKDIEVFVPEVVNSYGSSLDANSAQEYVGSGFSVRTDDNWDQGDYAIHSDHNYLDNQTSTYTLKKAIVVRESNALFYYRDVAIVETGAAGSAYPQESFYDYVIVEASTDGLVWQALLDGYDASYNFNWERAYANSQPGRADMLQSHTIDLRETFDAGDTIFIRFRLFADQASNGWGWAIDDIFVQDDILGIAEQANVQLGVYPNPVRSEARVEYVLPEAGEVALRLIDPTGREVWAQPAQWQTKGAQSTTFQAKEIPAGHYFLLVEGAFGRQSVSVILE